MNLPPPPFVLLEDSKSQSRANAGLLFAYPERILEAASLGDIPPLLAEIEKLQVGGKYLAGWLAYEAGFAFHPTLARQRAPLPREPLAWIGVFGPPQGLTTAELDRLFAGLDPHGQHVDFKCGESRRVFAKKFKKIQAHIAAGDIYQVNHTFRLEGRLGGSPFRLYGNLRCSQPVPYGAFIDTGAWRVLSFSPELFLMRRGNLLVSKPMKGTAPCGRTWDELQANGAALAADPKNRAENLMITDLIRNDISRVAEPGSVRVRRPFHVERFGRVLQMTSEVRGKLKKSIGFARVFEALFPCGSVTGAPKVRAMEIIAGTESAPRGVYTGALGFWAPGGNFTLNIPIRTLVLDREGRGRFGTGSGIVADSTLPGEYEECLLKARFLSETRQPFALIETLLWRGEHGFEFL
ncbi:MAG TPA: aminodeoxychorismate synthase component I, partial [Sphingomonadales bacterium]|nr:aminodeoxychorismate synthase component I [Sphingomonadales bacterium]